MSLRPGLLTVLLILGTLGPGRLLAGVVYWTDRDGQTIRQGDMDGSGWTILLDQPTDGLIEPRGLGLDIAGGKMYFADAGARKIRAANLDGSGAQDLITTGLSFPADVELDLSARRIYWTDTVLGQICSANFDGTGVNVLRSGLSSPYFFDLDTAGGKIYWAENRNTVIHVANMDGTGGIDTLDVGVARIRDVALDLANGKIYWGERDVGPSQDTGVVQRCNLDGSGVELLFDGTDGLIRPHGVELDTVANLVYWTDTRRYSINRGNMDGSGSPEILYQFLPDAWDLELDPDPIPEPSTLVLAIVALASVLAMAWRRI